MAPPRYWLVHTFAHALLRQMAMSSGYAAASLSERIYAWPRREAEDDMEQRDPAAGLLIMTTASDSDGTLGGLVSLSEPHRLREIVRAALAGMMRCSSDPVCSQRVPRDPEDFLHGAACHCCTMSRRPRARGPIVSSTAVSWCRCPGSTGSTAGSPSPISPSSRIRVDEDAASRGVAGPVSDTVRTHVDEDAVAALAAELSGREAGTLARALGSGADPHPDSRNA